MLKISSAGDLEYNKSVPTGTAILGYNGYFYATRVYNAVYNDLAEYFLSRDKEQPGKVYTIYKDCNIQLSNKRADTKTVGVCSDSAAYIMKSEYKESGGVPIALAGTVKVWVKSVVPCGAELVSNKNGFAIRASWFERVFKRTTILGKAIECSQDKQEKRISMLIR
jgi:hypothetical protein